MKRLIVFFLMLISLVLFTACGADPVQEPITDPPASEDTEYSYEVSLYFSNNAYIETGDEALEHYVTETRTISIETEEAYWNALFDALKTVESEGASSAVKEEMTMLACYPKPDDPTTLVVDLSSEGLSGGSLGESLFIGQVVKTLLLNDQTGELTKVQFLVDGQGTESLMGHIEATEPFSADYDW